VTRDTALLLLLIAVGTGWLLAHFALLLRTARARGLSRRLRLLAWLPPATPIVGWLSGARVLSVLWATLAIVYCVLRSLA
jgi:hypothetical protein